MTEDYKKQLIAYTTGLLNNENPDPKDFDILNIEFQQYKDSFDEFFSGLGSATKRLRITGVLENQNYDVSILYGAYLYDDPNASLKGRGFLIYLDRNNNVLNVLFKDKNGNDLRGFHKLYLDETSNRVYGVLGHPTQDASAVYEKQFFAYMNNLLLPNANGEYEVDITKSYDLDPNESVNRFTCLEIVKQPNAASYLMLGRQPFSSRGKVFFLKINVGSANVLKKWEISTDNFPANILGGHLWFSGDTPHFKVIYAYQDNYGVATDNGDNISYQTLNALTKLNSLETYIESRQTTDYLSINENEMYFSSVFKATSYPNYYYQARLLKYDGNVVQELYSSPLITTTDSNENHDAYYFNFYTDLDGTIYLVKYYVNFDEEKVYTSLLNFTKYYNDLDGNHWEELDSLEYKGGAYICLNFAFLQRNYNLTKIFIICGEISDTAFTQENLVGFILTLTNLFSLDGYNGTPYANSDVLVPKFVSLFSNNLIVFARNLYNITKQNNTTMSSVEIPNNYLNDSTITQNNLISKNRLQMDSDPTQWTKNIYEVVDLNFLNTISVIDEDTNTPYLESAIKLNNATTDGGNTNYQNTPCNKFRINYLDGTTSISSLTWNSINRLNKSTNITLYVDKAITSIDLISNDETTIYLTIPLEVEIGKYYTIKQKVRIGDKPLPVQLQYNNEDILYQNEPVMVYIEEE